MKWILILIIAVWFISMTACVITLEETEVDMLPGRSVKCYPYKKDNAIIKEMKYRLWKVNNKYDGIEKIFRDYLSDGYEIYDAPATGAIDLTGLAQGKYIVVWKTNDPGGWYTVDVANTITDSGGGTHEAVVIMGIKLDSKNNITGTYEYVEINMSTGNYLDVLTIRNINMDLAYNFSDRTFDKVNFIGCYFYDHGGNITIRQFNYFIDNYNYKINLTANEKLILQPDNDSVINNVYNYSQLAFFKIDASVYCTQDITIYNILHAGYLFELVSDYASGYNINIINTIIVSVPGWTLNLDCDSAYAGTDNIIYYFGDVVNSGSSINNFLLKPTNINEYAFIQGSPKIDFTEIDFTEFLNLAADIKIEYLTDASRFFNRSPRNYYNVTFKPDVIVDDDLKKFSTDYLFFIKREDIESLLVPSAGSGKVIYNYSLYAAGGHTTAYDYDNDENFLILANTAANGSGTDAVFIMQDNKLKPTIFTDVFQDTNYHIQNCFQIWEIESKRGLTNLIREDTSDTPMPDSPLSGSIRFNNWDNEVTVKQ